jgi:hypothetical protein
VGLDDRRIGVDSCRGLIRFSSSPRETDLSDSAVGNGDVCYGVSRCDLLPDSAATETLGGGGGITLRDRLPGPEGINRTYCSSGLICVPRLILSR